MSEAKPRTLAEIARTLAAPMAAIPQPAAGLLRDSPVLCLVKFRKGRAWVAPLGTDPDVRGPWIEVKPEPGVPVPVLEALARAWEDQADKTFAGSAIDVKINTLRDCARMLREAIIHGGQG